MENSTDTATIVIHATLEQLLLGEYEVPAAQTTELSLEFRTQLQGKEARTRTRTTSEFLEQVDDAKKRLGLSVLRSLSGLA